ncbi:MAG TPA: tetratricopeptide repeat protein, partial [Blastococcus sp.]
MPFTLLAEEERELQAALQVTGVDGAAVGPHGPGQVTEVLQDLAEVAPRIDLADVGRQTDAEWCFRRAADLGDTVGLFNLGNALAAQKRWAEAVDAYEVALAGGEAAAWRNLGKVLEDLGDLAGAMRAYRGAVDAGDLEGGL